MTDCWQHTQPARRRITQCRLPASEYTTHAPQATLKRDCVDETNKRTSKFIPVTKWRHRGLEWQHHSSQPRRSIWDEWSTARPGRPIPGKETGYPLKRRLGRPQSQAGRIGEDNNLLSLTRFEVRTFQPLSQSLYRLTYHPVVKRIIHYISVILLVTRGSELKVTKPVFLLHQW
jgi:hypothetical protein